VAELRHRGIPPSLPVRDERVADRHVGNVIRITSPLGSCRCLNVTCVTGESWTQAFGPPWPIQHSIYFDPLQPFVIVWQGLALYVD